MAQVVPRSARRCPECPTALLTWGLRPSRIRRFGARYLASIALVTDKATSDKDTINEQLQRALTSRVVIEQAKGLLAQLGALDMDQASGVLRRYARDHNERLSEVARHVASRKLTGERLLDHATAKVRLRESPSATTASRTSTP